MTVLTEADIERIERAAKDEQTLSDCRESDAIERDLLILCAEWRKANVLEIVVEAFVISDDGEMRVDNPNRRDDRCRACEQRRGSHHAITLACPTGSYDRQPIQTFSETTVFTP